MSADSPRREDSAHEGSRGGHESDDSNEEEGESSYSEPPAAQDIAEIDDDAPTARLGGTLFPVMKAPAGQGTAAFPSFGSFSGAPPPSSAAPSWLSMSSYTGGAIGAPTSAAAEPDDGAQSDRSVGSDGLPRARNDGGSSRTKRDLDIISRAKQRASKKKRHSRSRSSSDSDRRGKRKGKSKKDKRKHKHRSRREEKIEGLRAYAKKTNIRVVERTAWEDDDIDKQKFFADTHGDPNNVAYGSLYVLDVPMYHRATNRPQGLAAGLMLMQTKNPGAPDKDLIKTKVPRYHSKKYAKKLLSARERTVNLSNATKEAASTFKQRSATGGSFIPLAVNRELTEQEELGETWEQHLFRRSREYNIATRKDPNNIALWLEFVDFQAEFMAIDRIKDPNAPALHEKKLAIYQAALEKNPHDTQLLRGYLTSAKEIWDYDQVRMVWESTTMAHRTDAVLWAEYLAFRASHFQSFTYSSQREAYGKALAAIAETEKVATSGWVGLTPRDEALLRVFLKATAFERMAGQTERAIGAFQGLIEFNCLAPKISRFDKQVSRSEESIRRQRFEFYWEAEAARLGEKGGGFMFWAGAGDDHPPLPPGPRPNEAMGPLPPVSATGWGLWRDAAEEAERQQRVGAKRAREADEPRVGVIRGADEDATVVFEAWLTMEEAREEAYFLPCRFEEEDIHEERDDAFDDPYRVVLFEDISPYLFDLATDEAKIRLILAFLEFLGAPMPPSCALPSRSAFLYDREMEAEDFGDLFHVMSAIRQGAPIRWHGNPPPPLPAERVPFVRNVFTTLMSVYPKEMRLKDAYIYFEAVLAPEGGRKAAKMLLKADQGNLALYHTYAQMELHFADPDKARKVYFAALLACSGKALEATPDILLLLRATADLELDLLAEDRNKPQAEWMAQEATTLNNLSRLIAGCGAGVYTHSADGNVAMTAVLQSRAWFRSQLGAMPATHASYPSLALAAALLEYVTAAGGGIDAYCATVDQGIRAMERAWEARGGRAALAQHMPFEELYTTYVKRAFLHSSRHHTKPALMRKILDGALAWFPSHPTLLSLLVIGEEHSVFANRLRQHFDKATEKVQSVPLWLFSIRSEVSRLGAAHRIRKIFERAVKANPSVVLWRSYFEYELSMGEPTRAVRVYTRATAGLPFAKPLWLDGFRRLRSELGVTSLHGVLTALQEKELRTRTTLDEVLGDDILDEDEDDGGR